MSTRFCGDMCVGPEVCTANGGCSPDQDSDDRRVARGERTYEQLRQDYTDLHARLNAALLVYEQPDAPSLAEMATGSAGGEAARIARHYCAVHQALTA